jgi:TRAP-type C4-dicarboxylate transport system permease small subunit
MSLGILAEIDTNALFEVVWGSLAAVIVLSVAFSVMLLGLIRLTDTRREGRPAASIGFGLMAFAGLIGFAAAVIYGFVIIIQK